MSLVQATRARRARALARSTLPVLALLLACQPAPPPPPPPPAAEVKAPAPQPAPGALEAAAAVGLASVEADRTSGWTDGGARADVRRRAAPGWSDAGASLVRPRPEPAAIPAPEGTAAAPPDAGAAVPSPAAPPRPAPPPKRVPVAPLAPAEVKVAARSSTELEVEWQAPTGEGLVTGYELRGGEDPVRTTATRAVVGKLAPKSRSCFAVTALGEGSLRSPPTEPVCAETLPDTTPPSAPAGLAAEARPGTVRLRWSPAKDDIAVTGYEVLRGDKVVATATGTEASEDGLPPDEHCYAVRALDGAGNRSPPSATACARPPDVTPPAAPSRLTATASGESEVALTWAVPADDVGVVAYEVFRDARRVARVESPAARETGLRAATRACYHVVALDAAGNRSEPSETACAETRDLTAPEPVATLTATPAGQNRVDLSWSEARDNVEVTGYEVWRDSKLAARLGRETRYRDEGPKTSLQTCYAVRAFDAAGNRSRPSPPACSATPDIEPPSAPGGVAAAAASSTQLLLSWDPSTDNMGVTGYEVLRDGAVVAEVKSPGATEGKLEPQREYCFSVRAHDAAGNRSPPSAKACARTADPAQPLPPSRLVAVPVAADEIELRWEPSPTAGVVYVVTWDGSAGVSSKIRSLGTTPLTRLKVFGKAARERHCYKVQARLGTQESPETLPICAGGSRPK